jgi:hypothetical protein
MWIGPTFAYLRVVSLVRELTGYPGVYPNVHHYRNSTD